MPTPVGFLADSEGHRAAVPPQAKFYQCDLADRPRLENVFQAERLDAVMHFAGEALVAKSVASGEQIRRELGWSPKHSGLDEIISSAWDWKQRHPQGYEQVTGSV